MLLSRFSRKWKPSTPLLATSKLCRARYGSWRAPLCGFWSKPRNAGYSSASTQTVALLVCIPSSHEVLTLTILLGRLVGQATSNRSQMLSTLSTTLGHLKDDMNSGLQLHTAFVSTQARDGIDRLGELNYLFCVQGVRELNRF